VHLFIIGIIVTEAVDTLRILHLFLLIIINYRISIIIHNSMQLIPVLPLILVGFGRLLLTRSVWNQKNKEKMVPVGIILVVYKINKEIQVVIHGMNIGRPRRQNFSPLADRIWGCVPPEAYSNNNNGNHFNRHHRCFHHHHLLLTTTTTVDLITTAAMVVIIIVIIVSYLLC